jgi:nonsense-mediated mRNA decay protein 3
VLTVGFEPVQDDLLCLAPKVSSQFGGLGPMVLCTRVTNALVLTDPITLRAVSLDVRRPLYPAQIALRD